MWPRCLKTQNLDRPYILPEEFQKFAGSSSHDSFSILHLNIKSIKKNFDKFKLFFSTLAFSFSVICFSETWLDQVGNSLYKLPNYISKHQVRDDRKGGRVSIYIHNSLSFKVLSKLCINSVDMSLCPLNYHWIINVVLSLKFCTDDLIINRTVLDFSSQASFFCPKCK